MAELLQRADEIGDGTEASDTVPTGFPTLDALLGGGFRRGDLIVLGGDVGTGKSALALAMALRVAETQGEVTFFTGEMAPERVQERVLAIEGRASIEALRSGVMDEMTRASLGAVALRRSSSVPHVTYMPAGGVDVWADEWRENDETELVVVDSLQTISGDSSRAENYARAVLALKELAMEKDVAVLLTAHLPDLDAARENPRPQLDDFGAMGAVKQLADVVLGLFREEVYHRVVGQEGAAELSILKNRHGGTSYIDLYFYREWLRFEDMVDPDR
ncbi:MAG TPA: DnaB-like helicase C-terminal domain-containing protein [Gemmatimonadaceae bacterium]